MSSEMRELVRKAEALAACVMAVDSYSRDELRVFAENFRDEARALLARTEAGAVAQCDRPGCCCPTLLRNECAKRWTREELKSPQGLDDDCLDDRAWAKAIEDALGLACGLAVIEGDAYDWIMAKANELCPHAAPVADGAVARLIRPAPLVPETIQKFPTKTGATTVIPLEECLYLLYTHPQHASGDAREAERYRWLRDEASRAQLEMFADRRGTRLAADRLCDAGIDIAAMQAKEAK